MSIQTRPLAVPKKRGIFSYMRSEYMLYLLMVPGLLYFLVFKYIPMYGVSIAFQNYNIFNPDNSTWVGFDNFSKLISQIGFQRALYNNIVISLQKLVIGFPIPIILSLMINEVNSRNCKKFIQTSVILPNFVSWVVINGLMYALFSPSMGGIREIANFIGYTGQLPNLLTDVDSFQSVIVWSHVWKNAGMGTIVYLAALMGIDDQLYEAASIDGAGKWRQLIHITLPCIKSTIIVLLMFRVGEVMYAGFDQIFAITNPMVNPVADIIDTFVYRVGLQNKQFALATAAGLFQSVIGLVLVIITNAIAKKTDPDSSMI
ncbi:ABC transporter permease [Ruminiclostridium cellobioparum]|jgi:putative aldouronate transport system permease protein|uniref:ABC-type polysaccharide transport system, permease component n=1 Tax=Ruminiclostridium cellobioparum subsp. termitidis CT1112 TaxID=1195236 RepID=S0FMQ2_RUMCE|nr:ABC transporter permease subunit [Ruminiclostridium cellobioparum]EMS69773.1 ABC-type polysaccharide transport system, permease component [Ruminiclostridium cellobioparum subsp. termitidis CT1112]